MWRVKDRGGRTYLLFMFPIKGITSTVLPDLLFLSLFRLASRCAYHSYVQDVQRLVSFDDVVLTAETPEFLQVLSLYENNLRDGPWRCRARATVLRSRRIVLACDASVKLMSAHGSFLVVLAPGVSLPRVHLAHRAPDALAHRTGSADDALGRSPGRYDRRADQPRHWPIRCRGRRARRLDVSAIPPTPSPFILLPVLCDAFVA